MRNYLQLAALAATAAMLSATVCADEPTAYVGADIGYGKYEVDLGGGVSGNKNKVGGQVFVGFNFNRYVAMESGYRDFGSISSNDGLGDTASLKATAIQFSVLGSLPISPEFSVYGRLGLASIKLSASSTFVGNGSETKDKAVVGVGARYAVTPELEVRGEYDQYGKFNDLGLTLSVFSLGADYRF